MERGDIMQQRAKAGLYKGANERRAVRTWDKIGFEFRQDETREDVQNGETETERRGAVINICNENICS